MRPNTLPAVLLFLWGCSLSTAPKDEQPAKMKLLWEIPYDFIGTAVTSTPMLLGDSLVIMTAGKDLLAVEQSSGKIRWRTFVSNETNLQSDQLRTEGVRIYATHVEDVRAYNILDGSIAWITTLPQDRGRFWPDEIAYEGGKLYVGGEVTAHCLDALSGTIIWSNKLQTRGLIGDAEALLDAIVFGGDYGIPDSTGNLISVVGKLYWLNKETGDTIRTATLKGNGGATDITVDNGIVYAGTTFPFSSASFDAFDGTTGMNLWSYYTPNEGWDYNYAIVVSDKVIANAGPYHVAAFNKRTGQLLWRTFIVEDANAGKLHYYNAYVYHPHGIRIRILDPESGRVVYTLNGANENRLYTMAAGNGRIFVQGSRYLQCYEAYKP